MAGIGLGGTLLAAGVGAGVGVAGNAIVSNNQSSGGGGSDMGGPMGWLNFLFSIANTAEQRKAIKELQAQSFQQYADSLAVASRVGPETLAAYDASSGQGVDQLYGLRDRQGQGYYDRYAAAEGDLQGYGDQMKADIDAASKRTAGEQTLRLQEQGLYGSTTAPDFALRVEKERTAEQRRLGEDLIRQRVNLLSGLSADALNADKANTDDIAGWFGRDAVNLSNLVGGGYNAMQNSIQSLNLIPPPNSGLNYQLGSNSGGSPQAPGAGSYMLGPAFEKFGNAAGAGVNNWLSKPPTQPNYDYSFAPEDASFFNQGGYYQPAPANGPHYPAGDYPTPTDYYA